MPLDNKTQQIYTTLQRGGADVGTEKEFNDYFFAKGEQGYKNRLEVWRALKGGGADVGNNYEEFRDWLGLRATKPAAPRQAAAPAQPRQAAVAQERRQQQKQKRTMTDAEKAAALATPATSSKGSMGQRIYNAAQSTLKPWTEPNPQALSDERKAELMAGASDIIDSGEQTAAAFDERQQNREEYLKQQPLTQNVAKRKRLNMETGKMEDTYLTSAGSEYNSEYEAQREQRLLNDEAFRRAHPLEAAQRDVTQDLRDIRTEEEKVTEARRASEKAPEDKTWWDYFKEGFAPSAISGVNTMGSLVDTGKIEADMERLGAYGADRKETRETLDVLRARRSLAEETRAFLDDVQKDINASYGVFGGLKRATGKALSTATDFNTWDFGEGELNDALAIAHAVIKDSEGIALNHNERALLDSWAKNAALNSQYGDEVSGWTKAGMVTGEMAPFMLEMALNPASGLGEAATTRLVQYSTKRAVARFLEEGVKKLGEKEGLKWARVQAEKWVASHAKSMLAKRIATRVMGDVIGAGVMATTTGQARVAADYVKRTTGNVDIGLDDNGDIVYKGVTDRESPGAAIFKALSSTAIDNWSEMAGNYLGFLNSFFGRTLGKAVIGKAGRKALQVTGNLEGVGLNKAQRFIYDLAAGKGIGAFSEALGQFAKRTQWQGVTNEYLEEVMGNIANAAIVGDMTFDAQKGTGVFNLEQNIDTFCGVALFGGFMSSLHTVGYAAHKVNYDVDRVSKANSKLFGDELWDGIKTMIDNSHSDSRELNAALTYFLRGDSGKQYSKEEKEAILKYTQAVLEKEGSEMANYQPRMASSTREEGTGEDGTKQWTVTSLDSNGDAISQQSFNTEDEAIAYEGELNMRQQQRDYKEALNMSGKLSFGEATAAIDEFLGERGITEETEGYAEAAAELNDPNSELGKQFQQFKQEKMVEKAKASQAAIAQFEEDHGWETGTVKWLSEQDPMELDSESLQMADEARAFLETLAYPPTEVHVEHEKQKGAEVGKAVVEQVVSPDAAIDPADNAGQQMVAELDAARKAYDELMKRNEELAQEVNSRLAMGMSEQEVVSSLDTFRPEDVQTVIDYFNANARYNGFIEEAAKQIDAVVSRNTSRRTFRGTINGAADVSNLYTVTDESGNSYTLVSGNVSTDAEGRVTDSDSGLVIGVDAEGNFVQLGDKNLTLQASGMTVEQYAEGERARLEEAVTESIDAGGVLREQGGNADVEAGAKDTGGDEAPATTPAVEGAGEEPAEGPTGGPAGEAAGTGATGKATIESVTDKDGIKRYENGIDIDEAITDIVNDGLDVDEVADASIAEAQEIIDKINSKERKTRKNLVERRKAQDTIDYYNSLKERYADANAEEPQEATVEPEGEPSGTVAGTTGQTVQPEQPVEEAPEWRYDTPEAARKRGYKVIEGHRIDRQEEKPMPQGKEVEVQYSTKDKVKGHLTVSELDDVQGSHLTNGQRNEKHFLPEAQPKAEFGADRQTAAQTNASEENFRPELTLTFNDTQSAYSGSASQTNRRGEVIQGNGRRNLAEYIYAPGNEAVARRYKDYLKAHAEELGTTAEAIEQMEKPFAHIVLDVSDEEAIRLGQFTAQDLETGGKKVPDVTTTITKLGDSYGSFANIVLENADPDASLSERIEGNAERAIKWLNQGGYINDTEAKTLLEDKSLARQFVKDMITDTLFRGASPELRSMFYELPKNIQSAIVSVVGREVMMNQDTTILKDVQESILAYHELMSSSSAFAKAKGRTFEERYNAVTSAVNDWLRQLNIDGSENRKKFSNFALELAKRYKSYTDQKTLRNQLQEYYDLVSGAPRQLTMFEEGPTRERLSRDAAIKKVFGINENADVEIVTPETVPDHIQITNTSQGYYKIFEINGWNRKVSDIRKEADGWGEKNGLFYFKKSDHGGRGGDNVTIWFKKKPNEQVRQQIEQWLEKGRRLDETDVLARILNGEKVFEINEKENGEQGVVPLAGDNTGGQEGGQGKPGDTGSGEQEPEGEQPPVGGRGDTGDAGNQLIPESQRRILTNEEIDEILDALEDKAVPQTSIPYDKSEWERLFKNPIQTPAGLVRMGEHQFGKLHPDGNEQHQDRRGWIGQIYDTLTSPDLIVEQNAQEDGAERDYKYVFVKSFINSNGESVTYFTSVTVKKGGMEVVVTNHFKKYKDIRNLLKKGKLCFSSISPSGMQTETNQPLSSATTSETDIDAGVSNGKDNNKSNTKQGNQGKSLPREEYLTSHPLTESQIMADTEATEDEKLNAIDFLRGEDDSAISRFYYDSIYNRAQKAEAKPKPAGKAAGTTADPLQAMERAANAFREEQKAKDQQDIDNALDEFNKFLDDAKGSNVLDKFMRKGLEGNDKAQTNLLDAFTLTNEAQRMFLKDLLRLASKVGYAYIKSGVHNVHDWNTKMWASVGKKLKEVLGWDDYIVSEFVDEVWNQKYTVDGVRMRLSEHAERLKNGSKDTETQPYTSFQTFVNDSGVNVTDDVVKDKLQKFADAKRTKFGFEKSDRPLGYTSEVTNIEVALFPGEEALLKQWRNGTATWVDEENQCVYSITYKPSPYIGRKDNLIIRKEYLTNEKPNNAKGADAAVNVNKKENNEAEKPLSLQEEPAGKPAGTVANLEGDSAEFAERQEKITQLSKKIRAKLQGIVNWGDQPKPLSAYKQIAKELGIENLSDTDLQELIETEVVNLAREIANKEGLTEEKKFQKIVKLYNGQPSLNARDNDRINKQQYSTPAPMAFLMGLFAKPAVHGRAQWQGLEPSAGNGMLTINLPKEGMHVNDIDEMRLSNLQKQGFGQVTSQDGTQPFEPKAYDVVVTNPPFGNVTPKVYDGLYEISGLEHQMAINALESMKDDGRAAIIIGGNTEYNTNGTIKGKDRVFLNYLYSHYNVVDVINMDGKTLYSRQGTGYPVRMILINGRKSFDKNSFAPVQSKARAEVVRSYDELYKRVEDDILSNENKPAGVHDTEGGTSGRVDDSGHAGTSTQTGVRGVRGEGSQEQPAGGSPVGSSVQGGNSATNGTDTGSQPSVGGRPSGVGGGASTAQSGGTTAPQAKGQRGLSNGGNDTKRPSSQSGNSIGVGQRGAGTAQSSNGSVEPTGKPVGTVAETKEKAEVKRGLGTEKVPYRKQSGNPFTLQSLMPAEQADVVKKSLEELGDVDQFLVDELGYSSKEELHQALAAEQIDSVAMAIHQMNQGNAFIIGDQTGIGKGRQAAALIRYGVKKGGCPVFITVKKALFSDMYRDLCDIGSPGLRPFIWSADDAQHSGAVTDKDGNVIYEMPSKKEQERVVAYINKHGKLPPEYDYVLTTYDSFKSGTMDYENGTKKARNFGKKQPSTIHFNGQNKRDALEALAKNSYVIMDESHNAGGEGSNVGNYLQYITTKAKGITFLSATFAKRPGNMPIYSLKTAIAKAGVAVGELIDAVKRGGATFQEIMSKALTEAGQMIRRERDMTGVTIDWRGIEDEEVIEKQRKQYDEVIGLFNDIINFQRTYVDPIVDNLNDQEADVQGAVEHTPGTRDMGINNTPFASRTYNMVQQILLSLKAEEAAKRAIEHLKAGRKPVITVANTNEGAADEVAAADGESMAMPDLSVNLKKGLRGTLRITKKDAFGNTTNSEIPFDRLSPEGQARYNEIMDAIENASTGLSLSPIDVIKNELKKAGYKVGELTGRQSEFVYNEDGTVKRVRRTDTDKKKVASDFNNGKLDALILNRSAGTGISLHASTKFKDRHQRVMIVAQAQGDVNDEVQIRGRIDRTGQVLRGMYEYVVSQIPSEQRLLMMLKSKLRSLDANTTSSQKSKFNEMDVQDIINKYGDQIVIQYLAEHPDFAEKMQNPLKWPSDWQDMSSEQLINAAEKVEGDGATASKVLGRMALLTVKEQEQMLDEIGELYQAEIDRLNEMGENDLEITEMPLKAKTLSKDVWEQGTEPGGNNPFADNSYVERVQMDVLKKPMKGDEVKGSQDRLLGGKTWEDFKKETMAKVDEWAEQKKKETTETITARAKKKAEAERDKYIKGAKKAQEKNQMTDEQIEHNGQLQYNHVYDEEMKKLENAIDGIESQREVFEVALDTFSTDGVYAIPMNIYDLGSMTFEPGFGKLIDVKISSNFSPNSSTLTFATLDGRRKITVPINGKVKQQNNEKRDLFPVITTLTAQTRNGMFGSNVSNTLKVLSQDINNWDRLTSTAARKEGYIITGNLLKALVSTREQGVGGKLISFTTDTGEVRQGILMPDNFDPSGLTSKTPISSKKEDLRYYRGKVESADGDVTVRVTNEYDWRDNGYNTLELVVPGSNKRGSKYFNDKVLLSLMNGQFEGKTKMKAEFKRENLDAVMSRLDELGVTVKEEKPAGNAAGTGRRYDMDIEEGELVNQYDFIFGNDYVTSITGNEFEKSDRPLTERVAEYYEKEYNGVIVRPDVGTVILDERSVSDSIGHGLGRNKAAAFAAVPEVIKDGIVIARNNNWKGRGYNSVIIAAPIKIGSEGYVAIVVLNEVTNSPKGSHRFYLHEVGLQKSLQSEEFKTGIKTGSLHGDIANVLRNIVSAKENENNLSNNNNRRYDQGVAVTQQQTERSERIADHVDGLVEKLGTKGRTTVYHSFEELPEKDKAFVRNAERQGKKVRGWYENGRVFLYLPHIDSIYQAEKTIWHETVAHHGLRQLIGEENLNKLLTHLWLTHKDGDMGKWVTERMTRNGWSLNEAIEEYLAREAEKHPFEQPSLWQRVRWMVADALRKIGFRSDPTISDIQYLLWLNQNRLNDNDPLMKMKQQAFVHRLERAAALQPHTQQYVNLNAERVEDIYNPDAQDAYDDGRRHSEETDEEVIERLDREPKIKAYRAMQLIDGKLYPPMAAKQGGKLVNPIELGKWEKADEHPEMADENGKFKLDKGNGKSLKAAYNPYIHTSKTMLNDQFSEAQNRPNLVVVEVEVPESELTSGYKADKAKDSVGRLEWKAGPIQGQLTGTREVILSRWDKPVRIVPVEEVARNIFDMIDGQVDMMPTNVVTPQQRAELEKLGVQFVETDNRGMLTEGENKGKSYSSVYSRRKTDGHGGRRFDMDIDEPVGEGIKRVYEETMDTKAYVFTEAFQDAMLALKVFMNSALKKGEQVLDSQNAYMAENLMHGKSKNEMDLFNEEHRKGIERVVNEILNKMGWGMREMNIYLMTKSGLERNRELYVRDWLERERRKKIRKYEDLRAAERALYDAKAQQITQDFDDGLIDEEEKNKRLAQALIDAHDEFIDSIENDWHTAKDDAYADLLLDKTNYAEYLDALATFIKKNINARYEPSKHDYSGLTEMYGDADGKYDEKDIIDQIVEDETAMNDSPDGDIVDVTYVLWSRIGAANKYALERYREAGMRTDEQIDKIEQMFHFYVPMRGFDKDMGEDVYQYFTSKTHANSYVGGLIKHAKGRRSMANSPLSTMFAMAYKAISDCNQNRVKQHFYRFCQAHPNDLVVMDDAWVKLNEITGEWEEVWPDIPEDATDDQVRDAVKAFDDEMRQLASEDKAKKINGKGSFDYKPIDKKHKDEHTIEVMINGKKKLMTVVGNPRVAQAINGHTRWENGKNIISKINAYIKNKMSSAFTSYSPTFAMRNMLRDWTHFAMMLNSREGAGYTKAALNYYRETLPRPFHGKKRHGADKGKRKIGMKELFKKYRNGTLDMSHEVERDFKDFMDNGGVTGYVHMQKVDKLEKEIQKLVGDPTTSDKIVDKLHLRKAVEWNNKLWESILGVVEAYNEAVENNARFATYRASRHYAGRTKARSAYDAKEITVNFNRKGSGSKVYGFKSDKNDVNLAAQTAGITSQVLGEGKIFFNATIQAIANTFKGFKNPDGTLNKKYIAKWAGKYALPPFAFGLLLPYINQALFAMIGGDDDDPYANLPEWTRRKNLCFYVGNNNFVTIPVGQELAAFLALGDIVAANLYAPDLKPVDKDWVDEMEGVMNTFSPIDIDTKITKGGFLENPMSETVGRLSSVLAPVIAVEQNLSWTGRPIYKEDRFTDDEFNPEYQMVYQSTNPLLVATSKYLHELGGGDDRARGKEWSEVNPAIVQYLWEQYTGGPGKVFANTISMGKDAKDLIDQVANEKPIDTDFNMRKVEGPKAFFQQGDDRTQFYRVQAKFFKYQHDADKFKHDHDLSTLEKNAKKDPFAKLELEKLEKTAGYQRYKILKEANRSSKKEHKVGMDELRKEINNTTDRAEKREMQRVYNYQMEGIVDLLDKVPE